MSNSLSFAETADNEAIKAFFETYDNPLIGDFAACRAMSNFYVAHNNGTEIAPNIFSVQDIMKEYNQFVKKLCEYVYNSFVVDECTDTNFSFFSINKETGRMEYKAKSTKNPDTKRMSYCAEFVNIYNDAHYEETPFWFKTNESTGEMLSELTIGYPLSIIREVFTQMVHNTHFNCNGDVKTFIEMFTPAFMPLSREHLSILTNTTQSTPKEDSKVRYYQVNTRDSGWKDIFGFQNFTNFPMKVHFSPDISYNNKPNATKPAKGDEAPGNDYSSITVSNSTSISNRCIGCINDMLGHILIIFRPNVPVITGYKAPKPESKYGASMVIKFKINRIDKTPHVLLFEDKSVDNTQYKNEIVIPKKPSDLQNIFSRGREFNGIMFFNALDSNALTSCSTVLYYANLGKPGLSFTKIGNNMLELFKSKNELSQPKVVELESTVDIDDEE